MELVSKQQIRKYIKEGNLKDLQDVQSMVKDLFASAMQEMLEAELDTHLDYTKHDTKNKQITVATATVLNPWNRNPAPSTWTSPAIARVSLTRLS